MHDRIKRRRIQASALLRHLANRPKAGQIAGGFAHRLGGALYEEFVYGEPGAPLSVTFADYLIPTSCEVAEVMSC